MKLKVVLFLALLSCALVAGAADSFRLANGSLISAGKSKAEVIALAGEPLYHDVETIAVDTGEGARRPVKRESMTYRLPGSIGGMYLVVVTVENGSVVAVTAKQEGRL
jgi:hypothetical protein